MNFAADDKDGGEYYPQYQFMQKPYSIYFVSTKSAVEADIKKQELSKTTNELLKQDIANDKLMKQLEQSTTQVTNPYNPNIDANQTGKGFTVNRKAFQKGKLPSKPQFFKSKYY